MTSSDRPLDPGTLDEVASALAGIAVLADSELCWSDHGSDTALRRIAADATTALHRLGYHRGWLTGEDFATQPE